MTRRQPAIRAAFVALLAFALLPLWPQLAAAQEEHTTQDTTSVSNGQLIDDAYQALLGRTADEQGRNYWLDRMSSGLTQRDFLAAIATTDEHRDHLVQTAFQTYLRRPAEQQALDWFSGLLATSVTATTVRASLLGSNEYFRRYGGGTDRGWVDAVYHDVLGRAPEDAGRRYFVDQLAAGVPREPLASAILVSREATAGPELGLTHVSPERQSLATNLDSLELDLDQPVIPQAATVIVTVDGVRVPGEVRQGDFEDVLVFKIGELPDSVVPGSRVTFSVVVVAHDGNRVGRTDYGFYYQVPVRSLSRGDSGQEVLDLQNRLAHLGYWVGPVDGNYGYLTQQAVYAFQKYQGRERTGVADAATLQALASAQRPRPRSTSGYRFEVDKARQLLIMAVDGQAVWVWNTSTGTDQPYTYDGQQYIADTPSGNWQVYWQVDGVRESNLGRLYRPKYFHHDGIAVHGYPSVPPYPASHGCVRVSNAAIDWIWANDVMPLGTAVWVY